jgi:hypothetical protein
MKLSINRLVLALLVICFVTMSVPAQAKANGFTDNFRNWFQEWQKNWHDNRDRDRDRDRDCREHPNQGRCRVSVPEFSVIPGAIAGLTSIGTYFWLRRRV